MATKNGHWWSRTKYFFTCDMDDNFDSFCRDGGNPIVWFVFGSYAIATFLILTGVL